MYDRVHSGSKFKCQLVLNRETAANMLPRLKALAELPAAQRKTKIKNGLSNRFYRHLSNLIYSTVGHWLNRSRSRFMLEYRPDSHFDSGHFRGYSPLLAGWTAGHRTVNCGDLARFYMFLLNIEKINADKIPGDFVELGVYKGNSAFLLAHFARQSGRCVYLFDTFEGFDERDLRGVDANKPAGFKDTSLAAVTALVGNDSVFYIKGYFPESVAGQPIPEKIAIAHLDCDLYDPMKASLELFYPKLSPGGMLILHDYSSGRWHGATAAIDEFCSRFNEQVILIPDKSGTAIIRKAKA